MVSYRILITGSREWDNFPLMQRYLYAERLKAGDFPLVVVHGGARGADSMAGGMARASNGVCEEVHEAEWRPLGIYNAYAGHARNQKMVDLRADVCLAFFKAGAANRGTQDCVRRAKLANIPVIEIWSDEEDK